VSGGTVIGIFALAMCACAPRDAFQPSGTHAAVERCARGRDGGAICLEARVDCPAGAAACEQAIPDPIGQLRALDGTGRLLSFQAGAMGSVSRANHFQSVQRLPGGGPARFVVTRETERREETDIGLVEGGPGDERVARAFDTGTPYTHAGGTQRVGRVLVVPLERGTGGSAVQLIDFSQPSAPRVAAIVDHRGAHGEPIAEAGAAGMVALADGRYLLVIGTRHSRRLDFYRSQTGDLAATGWQHLDAWQAGELETAIDDRTFGAYQSLHLLAGDDGALYLLGSHRAFFHSDWIDLHALGLRRAADGHVDVRLTKVGKKHLECSGGGADRCNLDAGTGVFIDRDRRLRIYAVGFAAARVAFRAASDRAPVHMVEFVSRGAVGSRAARGTRAALRQDTSPRR
jgi:hypothetical protein